MKINKEIEDTTTSLCELYHEFTFQTIKNTSYGADSDFTFDGFMKWLNNLIN